MLGNDLRHNDLMQSLPNLNNLNTSSILRICVSTSLITSNSQVVPSTYDSTLDYNAKPFKLFDQMPNDDNAGPPHDSTNIISNFTPYIMSDNFKIDTISLMSQKNIYI